MNYFKCIAALLLFFPALCESGEVEQTLQIRMEAKTISGVLIYRMALLNQADEFLCVSASSLNVDSGSITFTDRAGRVIRPNSIANRRQTESLGFDYSDKYIFLQPKKETFFDVSVSNEMKAHEIYGYQVAFLYFSCRDIVDVTRIKQQKTVSAKAGSAVGHF
jgi:hypothetical protein